MIDGLLGRYQEVEILPGMKIIIPKSVFERNKKKFENIKNQFTIMFRDQD
jgi:hypothetical protein